MSKPIYHYDKATGVLLGVGEADVCPKGGEVIVPAFATDVVPPQVGQNEVPVFSNGTWRLVPDYRGRYFSPDGDEYYITELNRTPESLGLSATIPVGAAREKAWDAIKAERDRRKSGGVQVGIYWFHTDDPSRIQYGMLDTKATRAGLGDAHVLHPAWKTMSGVKAPMTVALLRQVIDAGIASETAVFDAGETHKAAMEASPDPIAYDFSAGWPAMYGDQQP